MSSVVVGADGRARCPWAAAAGPMQDYHDREWGVAVRRDSAMFERLTLEAFQSGLSWAIVLRKRERFREVFAGFDPSVVAAYDETEIARLLDDPGIIRNRAKILATIANARAIQSLDVPLSTLLWSFAPDPGPAPRIPAEVPARTVESVAMSKELKRRGFSFVGPTTAYALMQATGMVDDHLADCWSRGRGG